MVKTCKNPGCRRKFKAGHYGRKQLVCSRKTCTAWYKLHWAQTRQPPRGIPDEIFGRIQTVIGCQTNPVMWSLTIVARESGMRKGELLGLTWDDVLDRNREVRAVIKILGQWKDGIGFTLTKTKDSRPGYLSSLAQATIRRYMKAVPVKRSERVWPISESNAWKFFVQVQLALKIKNPQTGEPYRFHDLRHSLGRELVRLKRPDLAQKMLGHRKLETTMGYAEMTGEEILEDVERIRRKRQAR